MRRGEPVIGSWINTASPVVAELMAAAGFDFLTIDAEHSPVDLPIAQQLCQAIRSGNPACSPLVRVPECSYSEIKRYMDAGAAGIICPLVNTPEQAQEVVDAVRYPPEGRRGVGFCRDNTYGACLYERLARANGENLACILIEHIDGVRNIDAILKVKGIDAVFIGPYDLSASLGKPGHFAGREFNDAISRTRNACRKHRIPVGIHIVHPDINAVIKAWRSGCNLLAYSLDITLLTTACRNGLADIRKRLVKSRRTVA